MSKRIVSLVLSIILILQTSLPAIAGTAELIRGRSTNRIRVLKPWGMHGLGLGTNVKAANLDPFESAYIQGGTLPAPTGSAFTLNGFFYANFNGIGFSNNGVIIDSLTAERVNDGAKWGRIAGINYIENGINPFTDANFAVPGNAYTIKFYFTGHTPTGINVIGPSVFYTYVAGEKGAETPLFASRPVSGNCGSFDPSLGASLLGCGEEGTPADPVDLTDGGESYTPKADLFAYNPVGQPAAFSRMFRSNQARLGQSSPGLSPGWIHNYDLTASVDSSSGGWSPVNLRYPNGATLALTPVLSGSTPTGAFTLPNGTPMIVTGAPSATTGQWNSITITFKGEVKWTLSPATPWTYRLTRITNRTGQYLDLNYDSVTGLLTTVKNQAATTLLTLTYTGGLITQVSDNFGRSVYYAYGLMSGETYNVLSTVSLIVPTGTVNPSAAASYGYTNFNHQPLLSGITTPNPTGAAGGVQCTINYDPTSGKVTSTVDPNGNGVFYTYNAGSTLVEHKSPTGTVVLSYTQAYDSQSRQTGATDSAGNSTQIKYFDSANPSLPTDLFDEEGRKLSFTYDSYGNVLTVTTPRGVTQTNTYSYASFALGRLTQTQLANGATVKAPTSFTYYTNGLINTVTGPLPNGSGTGTTTINYDTLGNVTQITEPGNNAIAARVTTLNYTTDGTYTQAAAVGQPLVVTDANGNSTRYRYDGRGRAITFIDALGNTGSVQYNLADGPTRVDNPATNTSGTGNSYSTTTYLWTGGPVTSVQSFDESGVLFRQTTFAYGKNGEQLGVAGNAETTNYTYDPLYRVKTLADGNGNATTYNYNGLGQVSSIVYPGGDTEQFTSYDKSGLLKSYTDPLGVVKNFSYVDPDGQLTAIQYPTVPAQNQSFTYDAFGRLSGVTDASGSRTFGYDDLNNTTSLTTTYVGQTALVQSYTYHPDGSRKTMSIPSKALTWTYNYDAGGRFTSLVSPAGTSSVTYFANDWLKTRTYPNGVISTFAYNAMGLVNAFDSKKGTTTLTAYSAFQYDGAFNLKGYTVSVPSATAFGGTTSYTYDSKDRVTGVTSNQSGITTRTHVFDGAGNLTTNPSGAAVTYNNKNQITNAGFTYNANGNPTTYGTKTLTYDVENRLTGYGTAMTAEYRSDNLRSKKVAGATTTFYYYDGGVPVVETNNTGTVTSVNVFGPDGLVATKGSAVVSQIADPLGNIQFQTNTTGGITTRANYAPFGGAGASAPYGFKGQYGYRYDSESGLLYCQNRYYDPTAGRWLTRDPIGHSGGTNLYGYVSGNPIWGLDPLGLADMLDALHDSAVAGYTRGGFWGNMQAELSNVGTALLNTIGASTVKELSSKSGSAFGCGDYLGGSVYLVATGAYIVFEAGSFGRLGALKGATKGSKLAATEFSHWIPKRLGGPRIWWNGRIVSVTEHALTDVYRYQFLPKSVKEVLKRSWHPARQQLNRLPEWVRFIGLRGGGELFKSTAANPR